MPVPFRNFRNSGTKIPKCTTRGCRNSGIPAFRKVTGNPHRELGFPGMADVVPIPRGMQFSEPVKALSRRKRPKLGAKTIRRTNTRGRSRRTSGGMTSSVHPAIRGWVHCFCLPILFCINRSYPSTTTARAYAPAWQVSKTRTRRVRVPI